MITIPQEAAADLTRWVGPGWTIEPLSGDASIRVYYRIHTSAGSRIVTWYPAEVRPHLARSLAAYQVLRASVPLPEVHAHSDGTVLQEDAGDLTVLQVLADDPERGRALYRRAVDLLSGFQSVVDPRLNAPFTAEFFLGELAMARQYFIELLMGGDAAEAEPFFRLICENVSRHPYVLCHRDFHGQNIHVVNDNLYLIDYQDLRMGPDTYDLASLLRDRDVARLLGPETESELIDRYSLAAPAGGDVRRRYFETLLQRSIKILGTFAKQPITRGRMHYLAFIPATLTSLRLCFDELPEFASLRDIFPLSFDPEAAARRARELNRRMAVDG